VQDDVIELSFGHHHFRKIDYFTKNQIIAVKQQFF